MESNKQNVTLEIEILENKGGRRLTRSMARENGIIIDSSGVQPPTRKSKAEKTKFFLNFPSFGRGQNQNQCSTATQTMDNDNELENSSTTSTSQIEITTSPSPIEITTNVVTMCDSSTQTMKILQPKSIFNRASENAPIIVASIAVTLSLCQLYIQMCISTPETPSFWWW